MMKQSRRTFVKSIGSAGLSLPVVMPNLVRAASANSKLRVAFVATGGRGGAHVGTIHNYEKNKKYNVTCTTYCDVDQRQQSRAAKHWPNASGYQDYRRMFDKEHKNFDAVFVATPDHNHFPAAMLGLQHDKAVYCEKPLTWSPWEAATLAEEARKRKLPTQMGNQGHAGNGWRVLVGWIRQGVIGDVKEIHTWTNRPVWPQGPSTAKKADGEGDPVPDKFDWNLWLGPAPERPFQKNVYHRFKWRGWWPFGSGALGDMACHTMDGTFWAMDPGEPTGVEVEKIEGWVEDVFPSKAKIRWDFLARHGRPGFVQYWYSGGWKPEKPDAIDQKDWDKQRSGNLFIGTKGIIRVWGDYGNSPRLVPEEFLREVGRPEDKYVPESSPGHHDEFVLAASGQKPWDFPKSNFTYAGPFTSVIQLGNIALKTKESLKWDGKNRRFTNSDKANEMIRREPRDDWKVYGVA